VLLRDSLRTLTAFQLEILALCHQLYVVNRLRPWDRWSFRQAQRATARIAEGSALRQGQAGSRGRMTPRQLRASFCRAAQEATGGIACAAPRDRRGLVRLQFRQPWRDGTTDVVFDPVEFLARLAVLVPRPRINLILHHGVLGPRAAWHAEVVPRQTSGEGGNAGGKDSGTAGSGGGSRREARRHARGQSWASLMARTFGFDVLACPRCGGRLRLIALIEETAVIEWILRHLGVPTEIPAPRLARAPPLRIGSPDQAG
jgi:hypothetical protein